MLAFSPGLPTAYNIALTVLSLIAAIVLTGGGLAVAAIPKLRGGAWLGGVIVGGGIAAMHYTSMAAFGLPAKRLELEITETALVRDLNRALSTLRRIKMLGVRIAMDDFGTGYSSLSNLRAFPFDKIKIDGSFIKSVNANDQAAAIVRSVLGLGRALALPVLAEGVESSAEYAFLESELCNEVQGYYLGRPSDIAAFRQWTHGTPAPQAAAAQRASSA
jgi:EAL domain-containing protein (putative c-di-GMP-specific phosphodiesterase class I)